MCYTSNRVGPYRHARSVQRMVLFSKWLIARSTAHGLATHHGAYKAYILWYTCCYAPYFATDSLCHLLATKPCMPSIRCNKNSGHIFSGSPPDWRCRYENLDPYPRKYPTGVWYHGGITASMWCHCGGMGDVTSRVGQRERYDTRDGVRGAQLSMWECA